MRSLPLLLTALVLATSCTHHSLIDTRFLGEYDGTYECWWYRKSRYCKPVIVKKPYTHKARKKK